MWLGRLQSDAIQSGKPKDYQKAKDTLQKEVDKNLAELADKGYKYDPKNGTISGPFGTKSLSDIKSNSSSSAKGLRRPKVLEGSMGDQGGGSAYSSSSLNKWKRRKPTTKKSKRDVSSFLKKLDKGQIDTSKMAGMSRNVGNGKIGSSIGNLFKAIEKRYNLLERKKEFK